jgi:hypothetical protein
MEFSDSHTTQGSYDPNRGLITIQVPFRDMPAIAPKATLYSATGFSGTTVGPLGAADPTGVGGQINPTDSTTPFDVTVDRAPLAHVAASRSGLSAAPLVWTLSGIGVLLLAGAALLRVRRKAVLHPVLR